MKITLRTEATSLLLIVTMFVLAIVSWPIAPDRMPTHWNGAGDIDRLGGRAEGLFVIPLVALAIYALMLFLPRIDPRRAHYDAFAGPYLLLRTAVLGLLFITYIAVHLSIRGKAVNITTLTTVAGGVFFIVIGNYLPKIQSNWFVGFRTPWTLTSEHSWHKTHRLAGRLFVISGLAIVATGLLWPAALTTVFMTTVAVAALVSAIYSYFAWRDDPAR
jgi:uncharacterized membrane protein